MNKLVVGFIAIIMFVGGCKEERDAPPLSREKAIQLFVDIHFTDAMLSRGINKGKIDKKNAIPYYKGLLTRYGITRAGFDSVIDYYSHDYRQMEKMYDKVLIRIQEKEKELTLETDLKQKKQ